MLDQFLRPLKDLRISVTDRCNFRCTYCMPKEAFGANFTFLPHHELLTFEELTRTVGIFSELGVNKIRITGGEPLVRKDLPVLIEMIANVPGIVDIALTTNGSLLTKTYARRLREVGLKRISISLDALDEDIFAAMNGVDFPVERVLEAIDNASDAGLSPIKINMVVKRGLNDREILKMAEHFRHTPHVLRFIEFMDVGNHNGWQMKDVVTATEVLSAIHAKWPIERLPENRTGEVAKRYRYLDGAGEIGVIASVTNAFCMDCNRARLSSNGLLYTCLFARAGSDLRELLRSHHTDEEITAWIQSIWTGRSDRYSQLRSENTALSPDDKIEMHHIGG